MYGNITTSNFKEEPWHGLVDVFILWTTNQSQSASYKSHWFYPRLHEDFFHHNPQLIKHVKQIVGFNTSLAYSTLRILTFYTENLQCPSQRDRTNKWSLWVMENRPAKTPAQKLVPQITVVAIAGATISSPCISFEDETLINKIYTTSTQS